jgi:integrase/recombinase XerD
MFEVKAKTACKSMSNWLAVLFRGTAAMPQHAQAQEYGLYAADGARKYLNHPERERFLAATSTVQRKHALFALTLAWTGARLSEVLALTASSFQIERGVVALRTLKRRKLHIREVPIPPDLMIALNRYFRLAAVQRDPQLADRRLWQWHPVTAWRGIKRLMKLAQIAGRQACPRGLRHAFGVGTLQSGVPLNLTQRWLGHARISTTAIYANASGPEEIALAARFWRYANEPLVRLGNVALGQAGGTRPETGTPPAHRSHED